MFFESVFIKLNNFYINIYNINLSKNAWSNSPFLASKVGRPLKWKQIISFSRALSLVNFLRIRPKTRNTIYGVDLDNV